jgi:hypothetical protein
MKLATLIAHAILCLALSTHAEEVVRIASGTVVERATIPCGIGPYSVGATLPGELIAQGWRYYRPNNTANVKTQHWQDTGIVWTQVIDAVWSQTELDAQAAIAASNAAVEALLPQDVTLGKATLRTYPDGSVELVSGPLLIAGTTNGVYEITIDPTTGLVFGELDHASPRKSKAEREAAKADRRARIQAARAATTDKQKIAAIYDLLGLK